MSGSQRAEGRRQCPALCAREVPKLAGQARAITLPSETKQQKNGVATFQSNFELICTRLQALTLDNETMAFNCVALLARALR